MTEVHRAVPRVFSEVRDGHDWYANVKVNHLLPREMPARSIGQPGAGTPVPPRSDRVARGPARGIRCASAIVASVRALGLEVRAGLHTGECEVIGEKLGGIAVNIGARVASRAGPGEVLVSSTVKDLVAGSGIRFADRAAVELKGVPGMWQLFAVELPQPT